jgi:hypothetical protein
VASLQQALIAIVDPELGLSVANPVESRDDNATNPTAYAGCKPNRSAKWPWRTGIAAEPKNPIVNNPETCPVRSPMSRTAIAHKAGKKIDTKNPIAVTATAAGRTFA